MAGEADAIILLVVAFIFPPAAVAFVCGCGADLCLNILLTILGYLPGCLHAFWLVLKRSEANERYGYKNWTYFGMGEYAPVGAPRPGSRGYSAQYGAPPPPPPGQYPSGKAPAPTQAPVDQKEAPAPASAPPADAGYQAPPQGAPVDQKSGRYVAPAAPAEQSGYQAPPEAPSDQKAINVVPGDQKPADTTVPSSST